MRSSPKLALKIFATLSATFISFCLGGWAGAAYCDRWIMPALVKQYPNDGQLGLEVMDYAFKGAISASLSVLIIGVILTVKTSRRNQNSEMKDLG